MPDYIRLCCIMHSTALFIHTCIQQASFPGSQNNRLVHMSGMTDKYDIPVGDPCFGSQQTSNSNTKVTCPNNTCAVLHLYVLSELPMPMTCSIEADRHMGLTHIDEGQQYVTHPSRNQSRLWQEALYSNLFLLYHSTTTTHSTLSHSGVLYPPGTFSWGFCLITGEG